VTHVMFGDCRGRFHLDILKANGWGRLFATQNPTCFAGEKWGFDNGAYEAWEEGLAFPEDEFLKRLAMAFGLWAFEIIPKPLFAVTPDIVAGGCSSLQFSLDWHSRLLRMWPKV
jgi:hypothetical protein